MKIGWDYGHGAIFDGGAIGIIPEEEVINAIAFEGEKMLKDLGHEVILTKPKSATSLDNSLLQRAITANNAKVDLFVSHHANTERGNGHEIYVYGLGGKAEEVAKKVDKALIALGSNSRGVKVKNLAVLRETSAPAILIEYFFLDTQSNVDFYKKTGAKAYAKAVVEAITGENIKESNRYYLITNYLPDTGYGVLNSYTEELNSSLRSLGVKRIYTRFNEKGIWLETQWLDKDTAIKCKGLLVAKNLFYDIKEE